jgi:hypothetical protein
MGHSNEIIHRHLVGPTDLNENPNEKNLNIFEKNGEC